ncbi:MAG: hypothetical protein JWM03_976 [Rhodocyclales bacterium]|nr:hypothetical protein [Rhodocyclales bacterium]MDB5888104.1 hypothetical protein [Rhodocyclales bacterium]
MKHSLIRLSLIAAIGASPLLALSQGTAPDASPGPTPNAPAQDSNGGMRPSDTAPSPVTPSANSYNSQPDVTTSADTAGAKPKAKHTTKRKTQVKHAPSSTSGGSDSTMPSGSSTSGTN